MAFLVCLLFRESIGVAITKSFVIFVRKFFVSSIIMIPVCTCSVYTAGIYVSRVGQKLSPRPKPTPAWIASSITCVILEAIHAGVGFGLGPRLICLRLIGVEIMLQFVQQ